MKDLRLIEGCHLTAVFLALSGIAFSFSAIFVPVASALLAVGAASSLGGLLALFALKVMAPRSKVGGKSDQ